MQLELICKGLKVNVKTGNNPVWVGQVIRILDDEVLVENEYGEPWYCDPEELSINTDDLMNN
jgi:hypothetical protein